ncbi:hypothetical protein ACKVEX_13575 [Rhodocyclaceae bacterium SMB388]
MKPGTDRSRNPGPDAGPDADLEEADALLLKADALLRKHKRADSPAREDDYDDLPILTEIIDHFELPSAPLPGDDASTARAPGSARDAPVVLAEYLVELDTVLARELETWFANELPQLITRELDQLTDRLRTESLAHMRATLVPALSALIAERLDPARKQD